MNKQNKSSVTWKILITGSIVIALLIPAYLIRGTIEERQASHSAAIQEMNGRWGSEIQLVGPVLVIPFYVPGKPANQETLTLLPEELQIESDARAQTRSRGIFDTAVYSASITITGRFDAHATGVTLPSHINWKEARFLVGLTDLRGIEQADLLLGNQSFELRPGAVPLAEQGLQALTPGMSRATFALKLQARGSTALRFALCGKTTNVSIISNWANPSFDGGSLPTERTIGPEGFKASWSVSTLLSRGFPLAWTSSNEDASAYRERLHASASGVAFYLPVDIYQKATRSVKYAGLFLTLIFLAFFLFEMLIGLRIHPIQYGLVGAAKLIFYLLLLSLAEQIGFAIAYLVAATASSAQISAYSYALLRSARRASLMATILLLIYGYLYFLLQMENYALLAGSVGLFLIVGAVMFLTRNVSWYQIESDHARPVAP
ncbi:MAG: cell envelope integrity protein CreD [Spirochaetales bacterium]|nr:cell envelope integrity protein CreD [Spirochaetales bacterium]